MESLSSLASIIYYGLKSIDDQIVDIYPQIRFATIATTDGKIAHTGHRESVSNVLTSEESKKSLQQAINFRNARNDLSERLVKTNMAWQNMPRLSALQFL